MDVLDWNVPLTIFSTVNTTNETGKKIPTSSRQTNWLWTRAANELNQRLPGTTSAGGQSGTGAWDRQISSPVPKPFGHALAPVYIILIFVISLLQKLYKMLWFHSDNSHLHETVSLVCHNKTGTSTTTHYHPVKNNIKSLKQQLSKGNTKRRP